MADEASFVPIPVEKEVVTESFVPIPVNQTDTTDRGIRNTAESEGVLNEFQEGVMSGLVGIGQGIGELAALPVDIALDTDLSSKVTEGAEAIRDYAGLDPVGIVGGGAEVVTQFVLPAGKGISLVNKASKAKRAAKGLKDVPLTKSERFGLALKEIGAAGIADVIVSSDGTTSIGDFFEGGITQTDKTIGLEGRAEALRRVKNRLKFGAEAAAIGSIAELGLRGTGLVGQKAVAPAIKAGAQTATGQGLIKGITKYPKQLIQKLDDLETRRTTAIPGSSQELSKGQKIFVDLIGTTRYRGLLPDAVATERLLTSSRIKPHIDKAETTLNRLNKNLDSVLKNLSPSETAVRKSEILNQINDYLTNPLKKRTPKAGQRLLSPPSQSVTQIPKTSNSTSQNFINSLPKEIRADVKAMRNHVDTLSTDIKNSNFLRDNDFINKTTGKSIKDVIEDNLGTYLRRRYRVFEDAKYTPDAKTTKIADDFFKTNKDFTESELNKVLKSSPQDLNANVATRIGVTINNGRATVGASVTDEAARIARENFLRRYKVKNRGATSGGRVASERLNTKMFLEKQTLPPQLRKFLGEVDDPRDAYLGTVADLAEFKAVDDFFGKTKFLADNDEAIGKLFINPTKLNQTQLKEMLDSGEYVQLGGKGGRSTLLGEGAAEGVEETLNRSGWGSLYGYVVPETVYKNLTNSIVASDNVYGQMALSAWGGFLKVKAGSQYSKTILSPVTQVRNLLSASLFAAAQGNIGKGANLYDSLRLVLADLSSRPTDELLEELADMNRRGLLGTQAEVREIQDMLRKGAGYRESNASSAAEALFGKKITDIKAVKKGAAVLKKAEDVYTASDDLWKIYNYTFEQNKLRNALDSLSMEDSFKYLTSNIDLQEMYKYSSKFNSGKFPEQYDVIQDLIKDRAAAIVRDTVPNYNKAPEIIKAARKLPVGNFITFPYEIYRTGFNTLKQGLDEFASEIPGVRKIGIRRLTGAITTFGVLTPTLATLAYKLSGVSRDEMKAYQRSFGAPWEKNATLIPTGKDEEGNIEYINWSTSNPYDTLVRAFNGAMNAIGTGNKLDKSVPEIMVDVMGQALKETAEPFLSQSMVAEALLDVTPGIRDGRTMTGAEVYNPQDSAVTKGAKRLTHILGSVLPSVIPVKVSGGEIEPSNFARGFVGTFAPNIISPKTRTGVEKDLTEQLIRTVLGVTPLKFEPEKGLRYKAYELQREQTNAKRMFNRETNNFNATPRSFIKEYTDANEAKFKTDKVYHQMIEDLRTMGVKDNEIRKVFKRYSIGGVDGIMRGRFEPFEINKNHYRNMNDAGTRSLFPRQEINTLRQEYRKRRFLKNEEPEQVSTNNVESNTTFQPVVSAQVPPSSFTPTPVSPQNTRTSSFTPTPVSRNVDPSLLGSDPVSQAANAQIARRLNT